ncbi:MAG TPA: HAD-IIIC family phosphatase [Isosphaeraceae bacterium]|nr:HAD-IIIC family phosphatase [Isosphaeraceae bacterium]
MKLIEALEILRHAPAVDAQPLGVFLACGFMPDRFQTFLAAHLRQLFPEHRVTVEVGLYGDCLGNLERLRLRPRPRPWDAGAVVLEWPDFDPRLGIRSLGGWDPDNLPDILATAGGRAARLQEAIAHVADEVPLAVCLPTLPLPPVSYHPGRYLGGFELQLRDRLSQFALALSQVPRVKLVNPQVLDRRSPPADRLDVTSELVSGFPYRLPHASVVAERLAWIIRSPVPKKGLITDLDNTLWRGILGEDGPAGISWDLDHGSHGHGLYQQFLNSLAGAGILVAFASKNDPALVEEALRRSDLIVQRDRIFPLEVHWGPKSGSVQRILRAWNIGADSVIVVDDSPMELAEIQSVHPEVECHLFPTRDDQAIYELIERLREPFGKETITREDGLRLESLRRADRSRTGTGSGSGGDAAVARPDEFLEQAEAVLGVDFTKLPPPPRAFELVSKTNQFNLNGRRPTEGAWHTYLKDPETFLLSVEYSDKFGPLGTIAVLAGRPGGKTLAVDAWVMSCRAFSRRIEYSCLAVLFEAFAVREITFDFQPTPRNGPIQEFFTQLLGQPPGCGVSLTKEVFDARCPVLHHRLEPAVPG